MHDDFRDQLQTRFGLATTPILGAEFRALSQQWTECFCPNMKRRVGKSLVDGYRWHAYSFGYESAVTGQRAFDLYAAMPLQPFVMFLESDDLMFACAADQWPDLRPFEEDIYIFPRTMEWTFITTHEMSAGLGPYFATRPT